MNSVYFSFLSTQGGEGGRREGGRVGAGWWWRWGGGTGAGWGGGG